MFEVSSHFPSAAVPEKHNDGDFDSTSRNPQAEAAAAGRDLSFGWQMIRKAGAAAIVENLLAGEQISAGEFRVLSSLDFPLLAKIVEVVLTGAGPIPGSGTIRVRPVIFLPLAEGAEQVTFEAAVIRGQEQIQEIDKAISWDGRIAIAIDRWHGRFELSTLIAALEKILAAPFRNSFCALGPSTADLAAIAGDETAIESAFQCLKRLGIDTIEGGDDFAIHRSAAAAGFVSVIGQDVGISERKRNEVRSPSGNSDFFDRLYSHLAAVNEFGGSGGKIDTWFPRLPAGFDRGPSDGDLATEPSLLGLDLCRVFMLARLMLPAVPYIRAPLAKVGPRLAAVSTSIAANDLGFAAFDPVTAQALGVLEISKIEDIIPGQRVFSRIL